MFTNMSEKSTINIITKQSNNKFVKYGGKL